MSRPVIVLMVLLSGSFSACNDDGGTSKPVVVQVEQGTPPVWSAPGNLPCGKSNDPPGSQRMVGRFAVTPLALLPFDADVRFNRPWTSFLSFTVDHRRVIVCNLETGLTATVAEATPGGSIDYVVGSGDVVLFSRSLRVPFLGSKSTAWTDWTVEAVDLLTGRSWVLDRTKSGEKSPETEFGNLPFPEIEWPWAMWQHAKDEKDAEVWAFDFRSGRREVIAALPNGGRTNMSDGLVVYDNIVRDDYMERDLFAVPVDGSRPPRRLTSMGVGTWPLIGDGRVVWDSDGTMESAGNRETWMFPLAGRDAPVRLGTGSGPRPGDDFILVSVGESLRIYDPARPGEASVEFASEAELGAVGVGLVSGDLVLWGGGDRGPGMLRQLHLSRVALR